MRDTPETIELTDSEDSRGENNTDGGDEEKERLHTPTNTIGKSESNNISGARRSDVIHSGKPTNGELGHNGRKCFIERREGYDRSAREQQGDTISEYQATTSETSDPYTPTDVQGATDDDNNNNDPDNDIDDADQGQEYLIEKLIDKDVSKDGYTLYEVKWQNYGKKDNTWEPVQNLTDCDWSLLNFQLARSQYLTYKHRKQVKTKQTSNSNKMTSATSNEPKAGPSNERHHPRAAKETPKQLVPLPRQSKPSMDGVTTRPMKEWKVLEIIGITEYKNEKYFLLKLENYDKRPFIRASLANRLFPLKVIDFYYKNFRWKAP